MNKIKEFDTWSEAYDYCREGNAPIIVIVEGEKAKIYPSGAYKFIADVK